MRSKIDYKRILDDNKEIIDITPEEIETEELKLEKSSAPDSYSKKK